MSPPTTPVLVRARGLIKTFGGTGLLRRNAPTRALDTVDLDIHVGEIVALIGESGSGKTTLGKVLLRLTTVDAGAVSFDGLDVFAADRKSLRSLRRSFQMVFQNQSANLHPRMTVREMLDESLRLHRPELSGDERLKQADELLSRVGLLPRALQRPGSLSGGERRRAGLARILATRPRLIVADEPTSGLDAAIKQQMIVLLRELKDDALAYLLISHDLSLVRKISERVMVMLKGRIIEQVPAAQLGHAVFHHPYTEKLIRASDLLDDEAGIGRERRDLHTMPPIAANDAGSTGIHLGCVHVSDCQVAARLGIVGRCQRERPTPVSVAVGHWVACFAAPPQTETCP